MHLGFSSPPFLPPSCQAREVRDISPMLRKHTNGTVTCAFCDRGRISPSSRSVCIYGVVCMYMKTFSRVCHGRQQERVGRVAWLWLLVHGERGRAARVVLLGRSAALFIFQPAHPPVGTAGLFCSLVCFRLVCFSNPPTRPLGDGRGRGNVYLSASAGLPFCVCQSIPFSSLPLRGRGSRRGAGRGGGGCRCG